MNKLGMTIVVMIAILLTTAMFLDVAVIAGGLCLVGVALIACEVVVKEQDTVVEFFKRIL